MSGILDFIGAAPARIQALAWAFLAAVGIAASLSCWALVERVGRVQAVAERDRALDQVAVVAAAAKACSAGVDHAKRVSDAAIAATGVLAAAAARLSLPARHTVERTEKIIERTVSTPAATDCNAAWAELEAAQPKAGAP